MKKVVTLLFFVYGFSLYGQSLNIDTLLSQVGSAKGSEAKLALTNAFIDSARKVGIPIIQGNKVIFIYRGNPGYVSLGGDFNNWQASFKKPLKHIDSTNFHYQIETFDPKARFEYGFLIDDSWYRDPENPRGNNRFSELAMPEYVYPWEIALIDSVNKGEMVSTKLTYFANDINKEYNITIYLPYGYDEQAGINYPVVYFQDGTLYIRNAQVRNIFDNLIHFKKIEPLIVVFVDPWNRAEEYLISQKPEYAEFFATKLVNYIDSHYTTDARADRRLVLGPSYGGNISAYITYLYDYVFANCGLHSAAFRPTFDVYYLITKGEKKNVNYFAVWGSYEYPIYVDMRTFRKEVSDLGYNFTGQEYPEGHNFGFWKAHISDMVEHFFPYGGTVDNLDPEIQPQSFTLKQNYPNPFNPQTIIEYSVGAYNHTPLPVTLVIYDNLGRKIKTLMDKKQPAGTYQVTFDASDLASGIYYYKINTGDFEETKKMLLIK